MDSTTRAVYATVSVVGTVAIVYIGVISCSANSTEQSAEDFRTMPKFMSGEKVNITYLVSEYILTCGSNIDLCYPQSAPFDINITVHSECLRFRNCDKTCAMKQNCAPDAPNAYLPVSCVSPEIYPRENIRVGLRMMRSCPKYTGASSSIAKRCLESSEINYSTILDDMYRPVISNKSYIVYRNIFCAICNDELDTIPFKTELACDRYFDINSFSSVNELWSDIKRNNCHVYYAAPVELRSKTFSCLLTERYISQCNESGLWVTFDAQIDWACKTFNSSPYKGYKNVFCYICNPSLVSTLEMDVIDSCSMLSNSSRKEMETGCFDFPRTNRTYPFKNKFCQLCNGFSTNFRRYKNITAYIYDNSPTTSIINHIRFKALNLPRSNTKDKNKNVKTVKSHASSNYSTALRELAKFCGIEDLCRKKYSSVMNGFRSFPFCSFSREYVQSYCRRLTSNNRIEIHLSYDKCKPGREHDRNTERCRFIQKDDILSSIPVKSAISTQNYKNIYCARCNDEIGELEADGVTLNLTCSQPLEASLFRDFSDILRVINRHDCEMEIQTPYPSCTNKSNCVHSCLNRDYWLHENEEILDSCENDKNSLFPEFMPVIFNATIYKNVFCIICSGNVHIHAEEELIATCNGSGNPGYGIEVENLCRNHSPHPAWYPYKNIFCASCNNAYTFYSVIELAGGNRISSCSGVSCLFVGSYRTAFSLRDIYLHNQDSKAKQMNEDSKTFCSKGKELTGNVCQVLIEETSNLGYNVTFGLRLQNASFPIVSSDLPYILTQYFNSFLQTNIEIVQLNIKSNSECIEDHKTESQNPYASRQEQFRANLIAVNLSSGREAELNILLSVSETKNRTELETTLLKLKNSDFEISSLDGLQQLELFPLDELRGCRIDTQNKSSCRYEFRKFKEPDIKFLNVNERLKCVMTETENDRDIVDKLCANNKTFEIKTNSNKIHLCLKDWSELELRKSDDERDLLEVAYGIFSLLCTLVSALCLCFTFFSYVLFKSLRNTPGINIMNLVFSLFWAQLLLQFGLGQTRQQDICIVLGICTHYFWLASFCAMNVCSYHMFKVFHKPFCVSSGFSKREVTLYSVYIYGAPLSAITIFVVALLMSSDFKTIGYGENVCFLSSNVFVLIMFVAPAILIIIVNTVFFVITYWHIRSSPHVQSTANRIDFKVYLKLMTVTGIAWTFLFIDALNQLTVFSFIATLIGALQGAYIFVAFTCRVKIRSLYKSRFYKNKYHIQGKDTKTKWHGSDTISTEWLRIQLDNSKETIL